MWFANVPWVHVWQIQWFKISNHWPVQHQVLQSRRCIPGLVDSPNECEIINRALGGVASGQVDDRFPPSGAFSYAPWPCGAVSLKNCHYSYAPCNHGAVPILIWSDILQIIQYLMGLLQQRYSITCEKSSFLYMVSIHRFVECHGKDHATEFWSKNCRLIHNNDKISKHNHCFNWHNCNMCNNLTGRYLLRFAYTSFLTWFLFGRRLISSRVHYEGYS